LPESHGALTEQPRGTITLVFSDIEGSTKLLEELGTAAYREALAEHRRIVREAYARYQGYEVDYEGDAFFYTFATAPDALAAVSEAMQGLEQGPIKIRVGIHTGSPELDPPKYVGVDVHFAARIMSAGHGGQVLVSASTAPLVSVELRDLGQHRFKDLSAPERVYQLGAGDFPPLKTLYRTNLPVPATPFLGRERELHEVTSLLSDSARLVTLTGPGGTGKTRLALQAAGAVAEGFPDGVFWVPLAPLRDPSLVVPSAAQALDAKGDLASHVADRRLLLLLDNLEQVIDCASELAALVASCPNLRLVVTSRELLRVGVEVEYPVPPLADREAVELFCQRSRLEADATIAELCRRLDNLPLAVELAAARTRALTPEQILDRVSQRLDLLKGGRDAETRQQTLRTTIEWSYELLSAEEQRLFARLSVFAGGCTLDAAEDVCEADVDTLQSLVEKSLVRFTDGRYWMLETIREFAAERLTGTTELAATHDRLVDHVLRLVSALETSPAEAERDRLATELDNFRAALAWAEMAGHSDAQLDLIGRSWPFWWYRGDAGEGMAWVQSALSRLEGDRTARTVRVLTAGAMFAYRSGDLVVSKEYAEQSLRIARELADGSATIWPLIFLGLCASEAGDYGPAKTFYEEAIAVARATDNRLLMGITLNNLAVVADLEGDHPLMVAHFEEALTIARDVGAADEIVFLTGNLAYALILVGRLQEAGELAREALVLAREMHSPVAVMHLFETVADLARGRGDSEAAARLLGAAEQLRDELGEMPQRPTAEALRRAEAALRAAVGDQRYADLLAEGRAMPVDDAIAFALEVADA
jgi:predicted ATPase/class 3 adenylate cyclase